MDPTKRFSNRVESYIRYRPDYPPTVIELLQQDYGLSAEDELADMGAGVGHTAKLFAPHVGYIYAIEPNEEMNLALQQQMKHVPNFSARLRPAENTDLEARSVDFIICGQSYHWFNQKMARTEFERILNDEGYVVLMWNSRDRTSDFGRAYEQFLLDHGVDYTEVNHAKVGEEQFDYLMRSWKRYEFENHQVLDAEGLIGRFTSSSYAPAPGSEPHQQATQVLSQIFEEFAEAGQLRMDYVTEVIVGKI